MSLFALLYTADALSPEQVISILGARKVDDPFVSEDLGLAAHTPVYFALDRDTLEP